MLLENNLVIHSFNLSSYQTVIQIKVTTVKHSIQQSKSMNKGNF